MRAAVCILVGLAIVLTPFIRMARKYGWDLQEAIEKWIFDAPYNEIVTTQAMILFGLGLLLFGSVFAKL